MNLVVSALILSSSRTTHLSCRGSVAELVQKSRVEVVGRVVERYNAKVHGGSAHGR